MLALGMQTQGFAVWLASGGREAIELYCHHRNDIDVVLLDVQMRGLDGPGTLTALREINPGVCCCFMTGNPGRYTEQILADLRATAVFRKPFPLREVAQQLARLATPSDREETLQDGRWSDDGGRR
jgi:CheY-like chemotaxis protein